IRLHSAIGYVTPKDKLEGREKLIWDERDRKRAAARERRKLRRQQNDEQYSGTPALDFRAVRAAVSMAEVLDLLPFTPSRRVGSQLRGPCPVHGSASPRSRSFSANLTDQTFRCFKC